MKMITTRFKKVIDRQSSTVRNILLIYFCINLWVISYDKSMITSISAWFWPNIGRPSSRCRWSKNAHPNFQWKHPQPEAWKDLPRIIQRIEGTKFELSSAVISLVSIPPSSTTFFKLEKGLYISGKISFVHTSRPHCHSTIICKEKRITHIHHQANRKRSQT